MGTKNSRLIIKIVSIVILSIASFMTLYPILFVVSAAFSPLPTSVISSPIPFSDGFSTRQFNDLFFDSNFTNWFKNTLIIACGSCVSTVCVCTLTAYVFSRFKFMFKKGMMMAMLILQIFPSFVGMFAIYVVILRIDAYDQLWGLVLIYTAGNVPYNTWLIKSYLDTIPKSLDEAARIDGANHLKIFLKVIMPMAKPMVVFLGITSFTGPWMDYIYPKVILGSDEKQTLALGLIKFIDGTANKFTLFAAGAVLVAVPFVILFVLGQSSMVTGLGAGAVKE